MNTILQYSLFIFEDNKNARDYDLYIFNDFSYFSNSIHNKIYNLLDEIRNRAYSPETVFIISHHISELDQDKLKSRFTNDQTIEFINYQHISENVFEIGIENIVRKNNIVQYAPDGTIFKKTSNEEKHYFIKTSLALLEYPQICFLAIALHEKITKTRIISDIRKIYIDVGSITSLVQALIQYQNIISSENSNLYRPEIINFESYKKTNTGIRFNDTDVFTLISASTSGGLRKKLKIDEKSCLTVFYPQPAPQSEECLFELRNIKENTNTNTNPVPIPLTSDDFSLEHAKSNGLTIKKEIVCEFDKKYNLIDKILSKHLHEISISEIQDKYTQNPRISFDSEQIFKILENTNFTKNALNQSLTLEVENYIIYDKQIPQTSTQLKSTTKDEFIAKDGDEYTKNKNIIVFLTQTTNDELTTISQKLRKYQIINITYIIGVLLTDDFKQSKNLANNITYNDTDYKYNFYCYLNLPFYRTNFTAKALKEYRLSQGFIFDREKNSTKLNPQQVYLVMYLILEMFRDNNHLNDYISYHDVISPENFYRYNDPLLQLSILFSARGRELNFQSNQDLSRQMKNFILDLIKGKPNAGNMFIKALKNKKIMLTKSDYDVIIDTHKPEPSGEKQPL